MNSDNNGIELENICDRVRYAVSFGEELTDEMKLHLEECNECRTFLDQLEIMQAELGKIGVETFTKDGKMLAESVMEEVARQKIFTSGKKVKSNNGFFRHMGLIAACVVIVVMALPVMNGIFSSKDAVLEDSCEEENFAPATETQMADTESAYYGGADNADLKDDSVYAVFDKSSAETDEVEKMTTGTLMFKAPPPSAGAVNGTVEETDVEDLEMVVDDVGEHSSVNDGVLLQKEVKAEAEEEIVTKAMPELFADDTAEYGNEQKTSSSTQSFHRYEFYESGETASFESIEDAALHGALMYCDSGEIIVEQSLKLTYTDSNTAYAVFSIENNGDITVYLEKENGMWFVIDVCDGDITE